MPKDVKRQNYQTKRVFLHYHFYLKSVVIKIHQHTKSVVRLFSICICSGGEGEKKSITFVCIQDSAALMALKLPWSELQCVLSRVQCSAVTGSAAANGSSVACSAPRLRFGMPD